MRQLARILHQFTTATAQEHALSGFRSVGVLGIVSTMPARSSVAKANHAALLNRLATRTGAVRGLTIVIAMFLCASCLSADPQVEFKGKRFSVELATSPEDQALGLMFRDSLADDHGMLFLFPSAVSRSFWMKNTRIPLDIFYFDENLKLVSVAQNATPCRVAQCPAYPSAGPAKYVLELNAGQALELDARPGDELLLLLD